MLALGRIFVIFCYFLVVCVAGMLLCLFRPFHPNNVHIISRWMGKTSTLLGVEIEVRTPESVKSLRSCVYVANHQNSLDLFTSSMGVRPYTVTIGKKSLCWIPLFGQLYWMAGNILIDRKNKGKAFNTISKTAAKLKQKNMAAWIFPEGTRSYGRGLLPFKSGAFHTAIAAEVPLVPVCVSNTENLIKLNRWDNGKVIITYLDPIALVQSDKVAARDVMAQVHSQMKQTIEQLNQELESEKTQAQEDLK